MFKVACFALSEKIRKECCQLEAILIQQKFDTKLLVITLLNIEKESKMSFTVQTVEQRL